jgi:AcrR family transcriptional regulator
MPRRPDQKEWIRKKAVALWAKKGYASTGVAELSEVTGLGKGALYYHIGSKEQLLFEISTEHTLRDIEYAEEVLAMEVSAGEKLRLLSRGLLRNIAENRQEWTVVFQEIGRLKGRNGQLVRERRERYEQQWRAVFEEGVRNGEFRSDHPVLVKGVLGMHNYTYLWLRASGELSPEDVADVFCNTLLEGVLVASPAARADGKSLAGSARRR